MAGQYCLRAIVALYLRMIAPFKSSDKDIPANYTTVTYQWSERDGCTTLSVAQGDFVGVKARRPLVCTRGAGYVTLAP